MACQEGNPQEREDPIVIHKEMGKLELDDKLYKLYKKYGYSRPVVASLKFSPSRDLITKQYIDDYVKLDDLARSCCDDFIADVIHLYASAKETEFIVMAKYDQYTRPILDEEKKIDSQLKRDYMRPYTSKRMIKSVFPMIILKESLPCECNIPRFIQALDKMSTVSRFENGFNPVPINLGYIFYHVKPDDIKYLNIHKSGMGYNSEDLMPLVLGRSRFRVPLELSHEAIQSVFEHDILDKEFYNRNDIN
ncbi:MAG TPA: hypothetical protein VEC16_02345 [Alphaproteobacteria bacterium]|nr:hypothetical protein [Alphaproteobacteria bacterium]